MINKFLHSKHFVTALYWLFVIIAMLGFEIFIGANVWWQHAIYLLISLWIGGGVGALGESESNWEPDPYP